MSQNLGTTGTVVIGGITYAVDSTRGNKVLSVSRAYYGFGSNGTNLTSVDINGPGGAASGSGAVGVPVFRAATITGCVAQGAAVSNEAHNFLIRVEDAGSQAPTTVATESVAAGTTSQSVSTTLNVDVNVGQYIQCRVEQSGSSTVTDPIIVVEVAWRIA